MEDTWKWFHCTAHTYGAWLYGDPRDFRTRHHREHIIGDYKHRPSKGMYDDKFKRSKQLLKQEPVTLTREWRKIIGAAVRDKIMKLEAQLLCVSMSATHLHLLAKMPPGTIPRTWLGQAKKHSNFIAKEHGWTGKLWAVRSKPTPVEERDHQVKAYRYILNHIYEGAWVWDSRDGEITLP
jgi:REP element-mobilizing transposase RayT